MGIDDEEAVLGQGLDRLAHGDAELRERARGGDGDGAGAAGAAADAVKDGEAGGVQVVGAEGLEQAFGVEVDGDVEARGEAGQEMLEDAEVCPEELVRGDQDQGDVAGIGEHGGLLCGKA